VKRVGSLAVVAVGLIVSVGAVCFGETLSLDAGWRFHVGDDAAAKEVSFDDASWAAVNVPHDWAIAGPFDEHHASSREGAFLPTGVAWYRRRLEIPRAGRRQSRGSRV